MAMRVHKFIGDTPLAVDMTPEEEAAFEALRAPPTAAELDAVATEVTQRVLSVDRETVALGLVIADVVERAFGVSQSTARQQVRDRFRAYYRALLG